MDTNTTHTNGKSPHTQPFTTAQVTPVVSTKPEKYERLLGLVKVAVTLELQFKETMREIDAEMESVGTTDMPSVLMSLMRPTSPVKPMEQTMKPTVTTPKGHGLAKARIHIGASAPLRDRIVGLMSDGKERKSMVITRMLRLKVPSSAYAVLKNLVDDGLLVKTKFAHYKKE